MHKEKNILKEVAKKQGKSVIEIRMEMMKAIDEAYINRDKNKKWGELFGEEKPSPEEFIRTLAIEIKNDKKDNYSLKG